VRRLAFLVFDDLTLLDVIGPWDALRRVRTTAIDPEVTWTFVAATPDVRDDVGTPVPVDQVAAPLDDFDLLVVPGGFGVDRHRRGGLVLDYLRTWGDQRPIASVCSGSLLLGECGWLHGLPATSHHRRLDALAPLCGQVIADRRVVDAGRVVTAGGVTSGIDLGLHLVGRYWGDDAAARIARQMEWPPR